MQTSDKAESVGFIPSHRRQNYILAWANSIPTNTIGAKGCHVWTISKLRICSISNVCKIFQFSRRVGSSLLIYNIIIVSVSESSCKFIKMKRYLRSSKLVEEGRGSWTRAQETVCLESHNWARIQSQCSCVLCEVC